MIKNKISVCIATYKRPELLEKLLKSIINQKKIDDFSIELVVVDNDTKFSAKGTINKIRDLIQKNDRFSLIYDMQPEKNISLTRNKSLELASGEFIFFIDDDEYADELWMCNHIVNLENYNADASFGRVKSYFSEPVPYWIKECYVYNRKTNASGQCPANLNTGNCLIKSYYFDKMHFRFDKDYGTTGGEDSKLFSSIRESGAKFISCYESITYEFVPEERANIKWLIRRVFSTGNSYTRSRISINGKQSFYISLLEFSKGFIQFIIAFLFSLIFIWSKTRCLNWFLISVSNISKPLAVLGFYHNEYKEK